MAKFNMKDLLNSKSKEEGAQNGFKIEHISIYQLIPSEDNFYNVEDVTELKETIELFGLQQNLTVKRIAGSEQYKIISGHRRRKALMELVEEGKTEFEQVPCRVETMEDEIREELLLIYSNATTRVLSDYEKTKQATRMKELLIDLKDSGVKLGATMREIIAETLGISKSQVAKMGAIENNLSEEFKEEFKKENVNFSTAYELSGLPPEKQEEAFEEYQEKGQLMAKDVKKLKEDVDQVEIPLEEQPEEAYTTPWELKEQHEEEIMEVIGENSGGMPERTIAEALEKLRAYEEAEKRMELTRVVRCWECYKGGKCMLEDIYRLEYCSEGIRL